LWDVGHNVSTQNKSGMQTVKSIYHKIAKNFWRGEDVKQGRHEELNPVLPLRIEKRTGEK